MLLIYFTATLETLSIVAVICLFTNIKVQDRENLRLISRVMKFINAKFEHDSFGCNGADWESAELSQ